MVLYECSCKEAAIGGHVVSRPSIGRRQNCNFYINTPAQWQTIMPFPSIVWIDPILPLVGTLLLVLLLVGIFFIPASRTVYGRSLFHPSREHLSFYSELCRHWSEFLLLVLLLVGMFCTPLSRTVSGKCTTCSGE